MEFSDSPQVTDINDHNELKEKLGNRISVWITAMSLGDTICTTPTVRKLKELYPDYKIDVYAYHPEIFTYNPHVDRVYNFKDQLSLSDYYTMLNKYGYTKYFIPYISSENKPKWDTFKTNLIDFCSLMALNQTLKDSEKWLEVPVSEKENKSLDEKLKELNINFEKAVVVHPSITWPSRTWPAVQWQELTRLLTRAGYQVIAVGKTVPHVARKLENQSDKNMGMLPCPKGAVNLIDSLTVLETVSLLRCSKFLITLDSGLLHLGFCTDINIIGMFTSVHPKFRQAWRNGSFEYKFTIVPPQGKCCYCSYNSPNPLITSFGRCSFGDIAICLPTAKQVYNYFIEMMNRE
uniref:Glycosyl transferase family 9 n=1 Tax=uncultured microorganism TaxID=358574 RepID=F8UGX7_9ZZZZ|nr:glycosyl transferase family 9 [uncultured microorganism]